MANDAVMVLSHFQIYVSIILIFLKIRFTLAWDINRSISINWNVKKFQKIIFCKNNNFTDIFNCFDLFMPQTSVNCIFGKAKWLKYIQTPKEFNWCNI